MDRDNPHGSEVSNSDVRTPLPHSVEELADYAAHDLAELIVLAYGAPPSMRAQLVHIASTMQRLALYLEAVADEDKECGFRVASRAQAYEERLKVRAQITISEGRNMGDLLIEFFRTHREMRGPGAARTRHVGFRRNDDEAYGGG